MAKQNNTISQLDLIDKLLSDKYKDISGYLTEIDRANDVNMNIKIADHRINHLLYKIDSKGKEDLFPYFNDITGLKKFCDYILFAEVDNYLYLLLIELKKGTSSAVKQLKASNCFAEFILSSAKRIGIEITENTSIYKIRISEDKIRKCNKGKTKPMELTKDENDIINYNRIDFRIKEVISVNH